MWPQQLIQLMDVNVQNLRIFRPAVRIGCPDQATKGLGLDAWMPPHRLENAPRRNADRIRVLYSSCRAF